ncbi:uncharacterized protein LOC115751476 [Rhodamnia argentea]|uniref:Uncharacterized protein LOC115751476 n=1 Tax=Rhodamnia argentea TaxID=178133 RepID=A0A8B8QFE1_9MYRT|nr:uncharacterized protein LOC115751476 [Rhodamnia argentea]XP_030545268.1 uncharacterized protein LOC115751476 [Rhodamnia argentea]
MNPCSIQQSAFVSREEMRREAVVCPKPRRLNLLSATIHEHHPVRPFRWHLGSQAELSDLRAGTEVLEIILTKGGNGMEEFSAQMASSPPFFCGSPPSRVANPLIKDDRFGDDSFPPFSPLSPIPAPSGLSSSPSSSSRKGGCVRASFGNKPAVRVEGFDCLNRDRRNCGIPALA